MPQTRVSSSGERSVKKWPFIKRKYLSNFICTNYVFFTVLGESLANKPPILKYLLYYPMYKFY